MSKWLSPADECDLCGLPLEDYDHFVDGKTTMGPWALMCPLCHASYGKGIGTGLGQKYDSKTKEKIEG